MFNCSTLAHHVLAAMPAGSVTATDGELSEMIRSAAGFAEQYLTPLNRDGDRLGSRLSEGRVTTPASHKPAWRAYCDAGWLLLDADRDYGGLAMATGIASVVQEIFDQACPAFGMMPVPIRAGSRLLKAYGSLSLQAEWLPRLVAGDWSATICISEPDAGSDVRRLKTRADPQADGSWSISGEKCWISFGDQDISQRIGHFLLAKSAPDEISLFLVPDRFGETRNRIVVRRVEEKLGLHLSPTCALGFEGASAFLLGEPGRGLQQLFVMIRHMRLATAVQGAGIAASAYTAARHYAAERRQGGRGAQPVPIESHADVQRMLLAMAARLETLRALIQTVAWHIDRADSNASEADKRHSQALTAWLLPIVKTQGGEVAFSVASDAIQILGGAGYTRDWPVEQALRDARVLTIFEGTTGIQALDLRFRQFGQEGAAPYAAFIAEARMAASDNPTFAGALDQFEQLVAGLPAADSDRRNQEWNATAFLTLSTRLATAWAAVGLVRIIGDDPIACHLRAAGQTDLDELPVVLTSLLKQVARAAPPQERFSSLLFH